jgi:adenylyltransferase/sulfurtransferase
VLAPAAAVVASLQVAAGLRVLLGHASPQRESLIAMDVWRGRFHSVPLADAKRSDCPTCGRREFPCLEGFRSGRTTSLCGRNAVQIRSAQHAPVDLLSMAVKLSQIGRVQRTPYLLRCALHEPRDIQLTVFPDGRAIVQGTADLDRAASIYARFVGS